MDATTISVSAFEFELLKINSVIVHRVFTRTDDSIPKIRTSKKLTSLDEKGLGILQNRIVKALGGNHGIEMDIRKAEDGSFFRYATVALHKSEKFIEISEEMPRLLNDAQATRRLPGGLVLVIKGIIGVSKKPFIAVVKAEVHEGFSTQEDDTSVIMSFLDELALTPNQKLYKIGFLVFTAPTSLAHDPYNPNTENYRAFVHDHYMTVKETRLAASYFYDQFLGFQIRQTDKKLTRDFYNITREFISKADLDDEIKIDLQQSLYIELKANNKGIISISDFAESYLPEELRDDYTEFMTSKGVPTTAIAKDLEYIKRSLKRRRLIYSSRVEISAPPEKFSDLITVVSENDDSTTLCIAGKIISQQ